MYEITVSSYVITTIEPRACGPYNIIINFICTALSLTKLQSALQKVNLQKVQAKTTVEQ